MWSLTALFAPRTALVELGVVPALAEAARQAAEWRKDLPAAQGLTYGATAESCNRIVFACLGALGVLAVDGVARRKALKVRVNLTCVIRV